MTRPTHPQDPLCGYHERVGCPSPPPTPPSFPQHLSSGDREGLKLPSPQKLHTCNRDADVGPVHLTRPMPHTVGSSFFLYQESKFLSQPTTLPQVQINIDQDLSHNHQDTGCSYPSLPIISPPQPLLQPPQHSLPSPLSSHSISPLPWGQSSTENWRMQTPPQLQNSCHSRTSTDNPLLTIIQSTSGCRDPHHQQAKRHSSHPYPPPRTGPESDKSIDEYVQCCATNFQSIREVRRRGEKVKGHRLCGWWTRENRRR